MGALFLPCVPVSDLLQAEKQEEAISVQYCQPEGDVAAVLALLRATLALFHVHSAPCPAGTGQFGRALQLDCPADIDRQEHAVPCSVPSNAGLASFCLSVCCSSRTSAGTSF